MIAPYQNLVESDEVWCVNAAFRHQPKVSRVYAMDHLKYFPEGWSDEVNLLPESVRYITIKHFDEIPRSEPYPIHDILTYFNGHRFFSCTMAYMMAQAIREKVKKVTIAGAYWKEDSEEYFAHLPSMNFWIGVAMGSGMEVSLSGPCSLVKPYVWEPPLYGYMTNHNRQVVHSAIAAAYRFACDFPFKPEVHVDVDAKPTPKTRKRRTKKKKTALRLVENAA